MTSSSPARGPLLSHYLASLNRQSQYFTPGRMPQESTSSMPIMSSKPTHEDCQHSLDFEFLNQDSDNLSIPSPPDSDRNCTFEDVPEEPRPGWQKCRECKRIYELDQPVTFFQSKILFVIGATRINLLSKETKKSNSSKTGCQRLTRS